MEYRQIHEIKGVYTFIMKRQFIVEVEMPEDVTITEMSNYIHGAVGCECGSLHPDNPLFDLDRDSIKVQHLTRTRWKRLFKNNTIFGKWEG